MNEFNTIDNIVINELTELNTESLYVTVNNIYIMLGVLAFILVIVLMFCFLKSTFKFKI